MALDPLNFMFAIIVDEAKAKHAFEELRRHGLSDDDVFVLAGEDGAAWIDAIGDRPAIVDPEEQQTVPQPAEEPAPAETEATPETQGDGAEPGLMTRFARALGIEPRKPGERKAWTDPDRYKHAARDGQYVFAVRAPARDDQDSISRILHEHGGRFINYYGRINTTNFYR